MENSSEKLTLLKLVMYGAFYPNYYVGEFSEKREFKSITNDSCHNENVDPFRSIVVTGLSQPTEAKIHVYYIYLFIFHSCFFIYFVLT